MSKIYISKGLQSYFLASIGNRTENRIHIIKKRYTINLKNYFLSLEKRMHIPQKETENMISLTI